MFYTLYYNNETPQYLTDTQSSYNSVPNPCKIRSQNFYQLDNYRIPPSYFSFGNRTENTLHCQLRNCKSNLNSDLHKDHLALSPSCTCRHEYEDASHYLFQCPRFSIQGEKMYSHLLSIDDIANNHQIDQRLLLIGNPAISLKANRSIFSSVQTFISDTKRLVYLTTPTI